MYKFFMFGVLPAVLGFCAVGLILCCVASCGAPQQSTNGEPSGTLSVVVRNETDQPFYCTVGAGALSKPLTVPPRQNKGFWAYKSMIPDTIVLIVMDKEPAPAKRK